MIMRRGRGGSLVGREGGGDLSTFALYHNLSFFFCLPRWLHFRKKELLPLQLYLPPHSFRPALPFKVTKGQGLLNMEAKDKLNLP